MGGEIMLYIFENGIVSNTSATDTQLNHMFGVGNWQKLPNPPANMEYPHWNDTDKKWQNNDPRTYAEKRRSAYPEIAEQLDMLYHDKVNSTNKWQQTITAVKNKYPKDNI